jgi:hypothetical protein
LGMAPGQRRHGNAVALPHTRESYSYPDSTPTSRPSQSASLDAWSKCLRENRQ